MTHRSQSPNHALAGALVLWALANGSLHGAPSTEVERIAELLQLEQGQVLADVGAGDGDFSEELAARVGPEGRIYATEVKLELVEKIEKRMKSQGFSQVDALLGDQDRTGLPEGCCDAILLRLVYHHFIEPKKMRADLWRALRPNGLIAVVDITPQKDWRELPDVPDRGGHGIPTSDLVGEMTAAGFELVEERSHWNGEEDRFAILFRKPAPNVVD